MHRDAPIRPVVAERRHTAYHCVCAYARVIPSSASSVPGLLPDGIMADGWRADGDVGDDLAMSKLYFTYGAMNCGKSAALLQVANNYEERGMSVLVAKPSIDTKGGDMVTSRLGVSRHADVLLGVDASVLGVVLPAAVRRNASCVLVDESQFLSARQVDELHEIAYEHGIPVMCYGIRTGYMGAGFPGSIRLLEVADELRELRTICRCGKRATMNLRKVDGKPDFTDTGSQLAIDDGTAGATYESVCPMCWHRARMEWERQDE